MTITSPKQSKPPKTESDKHRPQVVIGSSRGGAVAVKINGGDAKLVLLCPAWKKYGTAKTVKPGTDEGGCLRVEDRRSEHIACSGGRPVLAAGELFLKLTASGLEIVDVSNQSTGFCPEPASWPEVAKALDRL